MAMRQVLVVEDEELVAMMLADMLMELNYGVLGPVGELTRALALVQEAAPDAALLDVSLHGVASFPLAEAARAHALMESGAHVGKIILEVAHD